MVVNTTPSDIGALTSLSGLSVGDAFGECFFTPNASEMIQNRRLPSGQWNWTDDTHMAISIVEILFHYGFIEQDALARAFSSRQIRDERLGYGPGTRRLLEQFAVGISWRTASTTIFPGGGSFGNGAAMRVAPIGGFFAGDPERAAFEAGRSAEVTHAHPEGINGAIAVAVAASIAAQNDYPVGESFIQRVASNVPNGKTRDRLDQSVSIPPDAVNEAVHILGSGQNISAQDTVPYCIWCAAYHLGDYAEALWHTVSGLGDRDTTCAMVGGIVALSARNIPNDWIEHREPLPDGFELPGGLTSKVS